MGDVKFEIGDCIGPAGKGRVVVYRGLDKNQFGIQCMYANNYSSFHPRTVPPECEACKLDNGSKIRFDKRV